MADLVGKQSIDLEAPAEVVFAILTDPAQHAKINGSTIVRHLRRPPPRLSLASRFNVSMRL